MPEFIAKKYVGRGGRTVQMQNETPILARLANAYCAKLLADIGVCLKLALIGIAAAVSDFTARKI